MIFGVKKSKILTTQTELDFEQSPFVHLLFLLFYWAETTSQFIWESLEKKNLTSDTNRPNERYNISNTRGNKLSSSLKLLRNFLWNN